MSVCVWGGGRGAGEGRESVAKADKQGSGKQGLGRRREAGRGGKAGAGGA